MHSRRIAAGGAVWAARTERFRQVDEIVSGLQDSIRVPLPTESRQTDTPIRMLSHPLKRAEFAWKYRLPFKPEN
jgi:hypothetical protein